jgi:hypothetical protein
VSTDPPPDAISQPALLGDPDELRRSLPRVIAYWREWLRGVPDATPRADARGECEQAFVAAVVEAALAGRDDGAALSALERAAADYGAAPRAKPIDPQELCDELGMLRHAIWRCVTEYHPDDDARMGFVGALDYTISIAVQATLRGGYRAELREGAPREWDRGER